MSERWLLASDWRGYHTTVWPSDCWRSEDSGMRALASENGVDLVSRDVYRNFVLTLEWWLPLGGNSGILYRVDESYPRAEETGPEMQLVGPEARDSARPITSCGSLYGLLPPAEQLKPPKEGFRTAQLVVQQAHVEHWLDGKLILTYELGDARLQRRIDKSKFAAFPRFGRCEHGGIVLQHHGSEARFRNLRIKVF